MRSSYNDNHSFGQMRCQVVREAHHNTVVDIVGPWLPRCMKEASDLYYASLLMLWKPWWNASDLKLEVETWKDAYESFERVSAAMKWFASNVQYRYDCKDAADNDNRDDCNQVDRRQGYVALDEESEGEEEENESEVKEGEGNTSIDGTEEHLNMFIAQ
jgi:hypothetical protein